ncbi:unnamed protein product [Blepharisma stoltei]|uniref:Uncharacterized protein n=1 Tax=Blepharisma stoltei TaxID=1481888 RepID=A0AAU9IZ45_9CILI|nr:unnamed protein product [Blepharisma stoltei]
MEIPEHLYNWLLNIGLFSQTTYPNMPNTIPESLVLNLESGQSFKVILKRLNQIKNNLDRLKTPMPEINTIKQVNSPSGKLYNWNVLIPALELFSIHVDPDTKSLIIAGDRDMLIEVLNQIYNVEVGLKENNENRNYNKPQPSSSEEGLAIDQLNTTKPLFEADTCLEYLIVSLCKDFELKPKQGAGLLAQGYKYLAHIIAKGLKGSFEPVMLWYQDIYSNTQRLAELVSNELDSGAMNFVMSALKPGLISKDIEIIEWTLRVFSKLALEFSEIGLLEAAWKWFTGDQSALEMCIHSLKRVGSELYSGVIELFLQIGQGNFIELFTLHIRNIMTNTTEYINLMSDFLPFLSESESIFQEIISSGVIAYWRELGIREADSNGIDNYNQRVPAINFLVSIITQLYSKISENELLINSIISFLNRVSRDQSFCLKCIAIAQLFNLLEFFANQESQFAPIVYRALTFLLLENYSSSMMREFMTENFRIIFKNNQAIPISILLDPLIKKLQVYEEDYFSFDFDFLITIAQHPRLLIQHAIQLIDILGKVYVNSLIFCKASGVPFTYLAARFIEQTVMQEYLYMFVRYSLNLVLSAEQNKSNPELKQLRNSIMDLISWIIQQWQDGLNDKIRQLLLQTNFAYYQLYSTNCKSIIFVLSLLGDTDNLLRDFQTENPGLFAPEPQEDPEEIKEEAHREEEDQVENNYQIVVYDEKTREKEKQRKVHTWNTAIEEIEKAKKKRLSIDRRLKEEEEKKLKRLKFKKKKIKKQLEVRKIEQGRARENNEVALYDEGTVIKYTTVPEDIVIREFSEAEIDEENAVRLLLKKYSRLLKVLFQNYSGTGYVRKRQTNSDFDWLAERKSRITESEYIKILKDHGVIPKLMTKVELRFLFKAYNLKILKLSEVDFVDYEGFKGLFCQIAYFCFSRGSKDYSHLPAVVSAKSLLDHMREDLVQKNISTELYDEPDPGRGDKDIIKALNAKLKEDPDTPMPDGYQRVEDLNMELFYNVPEIVEINDNTKMAIELLDEIFSNIGFHILEPQVKFSPSYYAKGIGKPPEIINRPPNIVKLLKKEIKTSQPPKVVKLSPVLKFELAHCPQDEKNIYEECAATLEHLLHTVYLKSSKIITKELKVEEKYEAKKEREKQENEQKKLELEQKRRLRYQIIQENIQKAKEERQEKLREDLERRKMEKENQEKRKRKQKEKEMKEKEQRENLIKQWAEQKQQADGEKEKEEKEKMKQKKEKLKKIAEEKKKEHAERLEKLISVKMTENKAKREKESKKDEIRKEELAVSKKMGSKIIAEARKDHEKTAQAKQEITQVMESEEFKSFIANYMGHIELAYSTYCKQSQIKIEAEESLWNMNFSIYNKFCSNFAIHPELVKTYDHQLIFKTITKHKNGSEKVIDKEDFIKALIMIASSARKSLNDNESEFFTIDTVKKLFEYIGMNFNIKIWKQKIYESLYGIKKRPHRLAFNNSSHNSDEEEGAKALLSSISQKSLTWRTKASNPSLFKSESQVMKLLPKIEENTKKHSESPKRLRKNENLKDFKMSQEESPNILRKKSQDNSKGSKIGDKVIQEIAKLEEEVVQKNNEEIDMGEDLFG